MSAELVSVVVPSYNHSSFIRATLDSIVRQSYDNIELIVVDDASADGSDRLLTKWASQASVQARFARVVVVPRETNLGAHATLNEGIGLAEGAAIFLCNSDDLFHPDRVARLVETLRYPMALSFSRVRHIDGAGVPSLSPAYWQYSSDIDWIQSSLPSAGFGFLHQQWAVSTGNLAFTPEVHAALGGFADLHYCHDWDFVLRACLLCEPTFVDECLYDYRIHGSNSFSGLGHLAERETQAVINRFWYAASVAPPLNSRAPTPERWPGLFEVVSERLASRGDISAAFQMLPRYVTRRQPEALS